MKNKKGFTLIEIIICIGVLAIVGLVSFVGINTISKNIRINKLEDIEDTIMTAAKVYLETNKTSYEQLYNEQNAVVVPLGVLVNEGLLDLSMTDLKLEDIDKEYVVAALGTKTAGGECVDITTETSWNLSKSSPLYICTDSESNSSNLSIIDPSTMNNLGKVSREGYYFKGKSPNNYAKFNGYELRLIGVSSDDSILVAKNYYRSTSDDCTDFNLIFNNKQTNFNSISKADSPRVKGYCGANHRLGGTNEGGGWERHLNQTTYSGYFVTQHIYNQTVDCLSFGSENYFYDLTWLTDDFRYLRLNSCMKIKSGTGEPDNPYILVSECK